MKHRKSHNRDWWQGGKGFRIGGKVWRPRHYRKTEVSGDTSWLHVAADIGDRVNNREESQADISVRIGPNATAGVSGAPAHFDTVNRELVVDSAVAVPGADPKKVRYTSRQWQNRNLRAVGLVEHELGHAIHSPISLLKSMQAEGVSPLAKQLAIRLEESRMEHRHVRDTGGRQDAFRAAASELILQQWEGDKAAEADPLTLSLNMAPVLGRQERLNGCLTPADVKPMRDAMIDKVGIATVEALEEIALRHNMRATENLQQWTPEQWNQLAADWTAALDMPEPEPDMSEGDSEQDGSPDESGGGGSDSTESEQDSGQDEQDSGTPESNGDPGKGGSQKSIRQMIADSVEDIRDDSKRVAQQQDDQQESEDTNTRKNPPAVASHRRVEPQEVAKADVTPDDRKLATALTDQFRHLSVPAIARKREHRQEPPGRLRGRGAIDRDAQRAAGMIPTAHPWKVTRKLMDKAPPPVVGIMLDVSGSMAKQARPTASLAWSLSEAARSAQLKTAMVTFGNQGKRVVHDPRFVSVTDVSNGGFENTVEGFPALDRVLHLSRPARGNRVLIIVTDLGIGNTQCNTYFAAVLRHLERLDVTVLWAIAEEDMTDAIEFSSRFGFDGIGTFVPLPSDPVEQAAMIAAAIMRAVS